MRTSVGIFLFLFTNAVFAIDEPCSPLRDRQGLWGGPLVQAFLGPSQSIRDCNELQISIADRRSRDETYFTDLMADSYFRDVLPLSSDSVHVNAPGSQNIIIGLTPSLSDIESKDSESQIRAVRGYSLRKGSESK